MVTIPEHVVGEDDLPRGPKAVARAVDHAAWETTWRHSATDQAECYALGFVERDGVLRRVGWAVWIDGFAGAFVYPHPRAIVPIRKGAKELKELLHGR